MKMRKILFLALFVGVFVACSSDDDSNTNNNQGNNGGNGGGGNETELDITGTWTATDMTWSVNSIRTNAGASTTVNSIGVVSDINFTITYSDDNTSTSDGTYDLVLTSEIDGKPVTEVFDDIPYNYVGNWNLQGSLLRISNNSSATTANISQLTDNTMSYTSETIEELVIEGVTHLNTTTSTITLTK